MLDVWVDEKMTNVVKHVLDAGSATTCGWWRNGSRCAAILVQRRNAHPDEGAANWGRIASLIETCKMNGVEPYVWLKSTLERIAAGQPQSRLHELLPWNFDPASS